MTVHLVHDEALERDEEGWYFPRCQCGWKFGPVPDLATFVDALMEHATEEARKEASTP